ncbi:MAG TPA: ribosomal protein S18-alanine N-acetyltransferase [Terriglobales bacterium]|nr:ribosomal protein S18-alanine N-acetyltransferase [Terriglobales bacterium]
MHIRAATPADIPALLVLCQGSPLAARWREADYCRLFATGGRVALVAGEGFIQGFIVGRELGPEWEIENLVVASTSQRRGLGMLLISELLALARSRGAKAVFLEVRESNHAARRLYAKAGFIESGRRNSYYADPEEDAVLCSRLVPAPNDSTFIV